MYVDECNCRGEVDTTTDTTNTTTNNSDINANVNGVVSCDATVDINAASPMGPNQKIPGLSAAVVGMYDITATSDLRIDNLTLQRIGLGTDEAINFVAVYTLDGSRVSNAKSFNSDDEAYISLNPKVNIAAGETETFVVVAEIGNAVEDANNNN